MKNNILFYLLLIAIGVSSCDREETITASSIDEDRVLSQIDFTNPDIQNWYNDYNMGVLFEYNNILDFAYVAGSRSEGEIWGRVEIPQIKTLFPNNPTDYTNYKAEVATYLNNNLFKYFKTNSKIATLMPYKVLVSESVFSPSNIPGEASNVITESDSRYSSSAQNGVRAVYNNHALVFGINLNEVSLAQDKFKKDNFYIFLSRIMGMHQLYDLVPEAFYGNKAKYYGYEMEAIYRAEKGIADNKLVFVIDKNWFYGLGFIDAKYFFDSQIGTIYQNYDENGNYLGVAGRITHLKAIAPDDEFVSSKEKDVRAYLNEMIHRNESEILAYPQIVKDNMKILRDLITGWGVDITAINPALDVLN